jgi:hypothetical protein
MGLHCDNHHQARAVVISNGAEVWRDVRHPPITDETIELPNPWISQVIWSWGSRYPRITSFWELRCPVSLATEVSGERKYLYAIDADGQYRSGQWLTNDPSAPGGGFPNAPLSYVSAPTVLDYVTPAQSKRYQLNLYDGHGYVASWTSEGSPPVAVIECSCKLSELQCGRMPLESPGANGEPFCCVNCSHVKSSVDLQRKKLKSLMERIL